MGKTNNVVVEVEKKRPRIILKFSKGSNKPPPPPETPQMDVANNVVVVEVEKKRPRVILKFSKGSNKAPPPPEPRQMDVAPHTIKNKRKLEEPPQMVVAPHTIKNKRKLIVVSNAAGETHQTEETQTTGTRKENEKMKLKKGHQEEAEAEAVVDDEINQLFSKNKKKQNMEKSPAEIGLLVENILAELEVAAEEDAELNREEKPAIIKLQKLPMLTQFLSKRHLQPHFLDHGVLTIFKNWLEPLPDGSLPNITIRTAILKLLTDDFSIDLQQFERREQLRKSGLGKLVMFLSRSYDEETTHNRKLAHDLVDKWSRAVFEEKSTARCDGRATVMPMDFVRAAKAKKGQHRQNIEKRLQQLKRKASVPRKKQLQGPALVMLPVLCT